MDLLENLYEKPPLATNFYPRAYQIEHKKTLIKTMPKSGTTSIIVDFLSSLEPKNYLYMDLNDLRILHVKKEKLNIFIEKNNISYLVVENYTADFSLPHVKNIILTCKNQNLHVENFFSLHVKGLSFEEFIAHEKRHFDTKHLFSLYAKAGTLPKSASLDEYENKFYLQEVLHVNLDQMSLQLFCLLAKNQSCTYSLLKAYNKLKQSIKISKDKLYEKAKELENMGFISFIERYNSPKSAKKIYLNNFAYKNAITFEKDFIKRFENMIFCQILHEEIYYTNELHFYLPRKNQAILAIPFLPSEIILRRFSKLISSLKRLHVKTLHAITLNNADKKEIEGITCEILPFWEWALSL